MNKSISILLLAVVITHTYSVFVESPKAKGIGKETIHTHYKPRRHEYRKSTFADESHDSVKTPTFKTTELQAKKRISVVESSLDAGQGFNSSTNNNVYETKLTYRPGPDFYADIFKIPISVLQAVSNFLGNNVAYVNNTVVQGAAAAVTGTKPKPLVIGSLSLLSPSLSSDSSSSPQSIISPSESAETPSSLPEAEELPSSLTETADYPSLSPEFGVSSRQ